MTLTFIPWKSTGTWPSRAGWWQLFRRDCQSGGRFDGGKGGRRQVWGCVPDVATISVPLRIGAQNAEKLSRRRFNFELHQYPSSGDWQLSAGFVYILKVPSRPLGGLRVGCSMRTSRIKSVAVRLLALVLAVICSSSKGAIVVDLSNVVGPKVEYWGWDLKGKPDLFDDPRQVEQHFSNGANLLRIPIY